MTSLAALNSDDIGKLGIGVIVALILIGALLSMVITAVVGRVIILVAVIALGSLIWQQRVVIQDRVKDCKLDMSFLGVTVEAPDDVVDKCHQSQRFTR